MSNLIPRASTLSLYLQRRNCSSHGAEVASLMILVLMSWQYSRCKLLFRSLGSRHSLTFYSPSGVSLILLTIELTQSVGWGMTSSAITSLSSAFTRELWTGTVRGLERLQSSCQYQLHVVVLPLLHAKPKQAGGEAACREKRGRLDPYIITSNRGFQSYWMRSITRRILREKADCKQSKCILKAQNC